MNDIITMYIVSIILFILTFYIPYQTKGLSLSLSALFLGVALLLTFPFILHLAGKSSLLLALITITSVITVNYFLIYLFMTILTFLNLNKKRIRNRQVNTTKTNRGK